MFPVVQLTHMTVAEVLASLVCFQAYSDYGCSRMVLEVAKGFRHRRSRTRHSAVPLGSGQPGLVTRRIQLTTLAVLDSTRFRLRLHSDICRPYPSPRYLCRFQCLALESLDPLAAQRGAACRPEAVGTCGGSGPIYPALSLQRFSIDWCSDHARLSYRHLGSCMLRPSAKNSNLAGLRRANPLHDNCDNAAHSPTCIFQHWKIGK